MSTSRNSLDAPGIVDLTLPLEDGMISYPTSSHVRFAAAIKGRIAIEGRETRELTIGSHAGTHIDAPRHFLPGAAGIDALPLSVLIGPAFLVDLGLPGPGTVIRTEALAAGLPLSGPLERVVLRTGWDRFWNTSEYYRRWPVLADVAVDFLLGRGLKALAMDFPSPDPAYSGDDPSRDCPLHKRLLAKGVILIEYLTNLNKLPAGKIFLMAMPLKLKGFDGSPARVAAYALAPES